MFLRSSFAFQTLAWAEVDPGFLDMKDLACPSCGDALAGHGQVRQDRGQQYIQCTACDVHYVARGGTFRNHGEHNRARWCGQCAAWRDAGYEGCVGEIGACTICGLDFDYAYYSPEARAVQTLAQAARGHRTPPTS